MTSLRSPQTTGRNGPHVLQHRTDPQRGPRGPSRRRQNHACSKPCCMPAAQSRRQARSNAAAPCPISIRSKRNAATRSTPRSPASTTPRRPPPIHVNLIDTPGYPDFRGPTLSALAAVETVAIVVDADTGIGYGTRRMMDHAKARNLCRVIVVNKIDHPGAKLGALLDDLRETFGTRSAAAQPAGRWRQARGRLLLAIHRRQRSRPGRRLAPEDHRPGGRDQRDGDGPLPRPGRVRPAGRGTARRLRAVPARRPPGAGLLRLRAQRRRRQGTAGRRRKTVPASGRRQSAAVRQGQRRRAPRRSRPSPIRRRTSSPTCSRSSTIRSSASSASSASTRAR